MQVSDQGILVLIFSCMHSFSLRSLPFSLMLLHSHSSCSFVLCLSVSLSDSSDSSQTYSVLLFLGKICPFCYSTSGQGLMIQDSLITEDNLALWTFLTGFAGEIFFPLRCPLSPSAIISLLGGKRVWGEGREARLAALVDIGVTVPINQRTCFLTETPLWPWGVWQMT